MSSRLRPWMLVSAVWLAPAVLATISRVVESRLNGDPAPGASDLIWAGGDWLVYAILVPPVFAISRRWPIARPHVARRAVLHLVFALLFCVAWATSGKLLQAVLGWLFRHDEFVAMLHKAGDRVWATLGADLLGWVFVTLPFGVVVYLCIAGIAHAIRYFVEASDREVQLVRLSEQLAGARFAALQAQVNPHFLFNTLNTIVVRARDGDGPGTARLVEQLSDMLRRTLNRDQANETTLEDELELVRQYLAIEQARFSDRLVPVFEIDPATLRAAVPSFAVQHLVENAIRHGIARRTDAGRVLITARRERDSLVIAVEDDGVGIGAAGAAGTDAAARAKSRGLDNTRERLRALYGDRASLVVAPRAGQGTIATLQVPWREAPKEPADGAR